MLHRSDREPLAAMLFILIASLKDITPALCITHTRPLRSSVACSGYRIRPSNLTSPHLTRWWQTEIWLQRGEGLGTAAAALPTLLQHARHRSVVRLLILET